MYMWSESTAGRGSEEMASCLVMAVEDLTERQEVDELILHSDSCRGQNKNFTMLSLMHVHVENGIPKISHKFEQTVKAGHQY